MTQEFKWDQNPLSKIWWLQQAPAHKSIGLVHRNSPTEWCNQDVYDWRVASWLPKESFIANLPAGMPETEALEAAKLLILLRLKLCD